MDFWIVIVFVVDDHNSHDVTIAHAIRSMPQTKAKPTEIQLDDER